jgi:hypothetical protein
MALASGHQQYERFGMSVGAHMDLYAEPATAAAQRFARLSAAGPCCMLVGAPDGAVDNVHRPVQLTLLVRVALKRRQL